MKNTQPGFLIKGTDVDPEHINNEVDDTSLGNELRS